MVKLRLASADVFWEEWLPTPGACPVLLQREFDSAAKLNRTVIGCEATEGSSRLAEVAVNDVVGHETAGYE
jgi:hypothetical protein